jgi:hypothetical protein
MMEDFVLVEDRDEYNMIREGLKWLVEEDK